MLSVLGLSANAAWACSCPTWDARWYSEVAETILVVEIERYDQTQSRTVDWRNHRAVKAVPFKVRVLETLKGTSPPNGEMLAVGFEFACNPAFREGDRRILLLQRSRENYVHLCSERPAEASKVQELKAALGKQ